MGRPLLAASLSESTVANLNTRLKSLNAEADGLTDNFSYGTIMATLDVLIKLTGGVKDSTHFQFKNIVFDDTKAKIDDVIDQLTAAITAIEGASTYTSISSIAAQTIFSFIETTATSVTYYPTATSDDGSTTATGNIKSAENFVEMGQRGAVWSDMSWPFIRFPSVAITQGATINSAYIRLTSEGNYADAPETYKIHFHDADNPVAPANNDGNNEIFLRDLTTAYVDWDPTAWTTDTQYDTPDIAAPLQEIINRGGWSSGNAVMVIMAVNAIGGSRLFWDYQYNGGANKAELHINWG